MNDSILIVRMMKAPCILLLLCIVFAGWSGCTGTPADKPVPERPVFSNGSVVTEGPWISMDPAGNHTKGGTFTFSGSTNLPAKEIIEVIIVQSGPSAAEIQTLDDCITTRQKCVLFYGKVPGTGTGVGRWSITTDDSIDIFRNASPGRYTAIIRQTQGNISARSEFGLA